MKALIAALLLVACAAHAESRAKSYEECVAFADMALVSSTLAKHGITRERAATMLPDIYSLEDGDVKDIAGKILDAAYRRSSVDPAEPRAFALALGNTCIKNGGRLEGFLGVKS